MERDCHQIPVCLKLAGFTRFACFGWGGPAPLAPSTMPRLWLIFLPMLFLPEFETPGVGQLGTAELVDYLVVPFVGLASLAGRRSGTAPWRRSLPMLLGFVAWAGLSTLTINLRYGYLDSGAIQFGLVKIGKFLAYGAAGLLTMRALEFDPRARALFPWSLLGCCLVMSVSLVLLRFAEPIPVPIREQSFGYESTNLIGVALATLSASVLSLWIAGGGSSVWRVAMSVSFTVLFVGLAFSNARGAWFAAIVSGVYVSLRLGMRPAFVIVASLGLGALFITYEGEEGFRQQVDVTLDPSHLNRPSDFATSLGVDDGSRLQTWLNEAPKLIGAPVLGSGLYHRGGSTGLWTTGSHNFWLQMFLETGLVGGTLMLLWIRSLWRGIRSVEKRAPDLAIPALGALIAAFVGGLSGEYFYGGRALLALLLGIALPLSLARVVPAASFQRPSPHGVRPNSHLSRRLVLEET